MKHKGLVTVRLAVTGHRPDKLGGYKNEVYRRLRRLAKEQLSEFEDIEYVLTGMALGWDQAIADSCVDLEIPFVACCPFMGQEKVWPAGSQMHYRELLGLAKEVIYVCEGGYAGWKMLRRDEYMVDNSDHLLALWNGSKGGTGHTAQYALNKQHPVTNCWTQWLSE